MRSVFSLALVFLPLFVEAVRARTNEIGQVARGGVEAPGDVYTVMRLAYPLSFLLMILEGALRMDPPSWWRGWPSSSSAKPSSGGPS